MTFHDVHIPGSLQYGSGFGPTHSTSIFVTASGHEIRTTQFSQPRHRLRLTRTLQTQAEAAAIKDHAMARRGSVYSFPQQDVSDYTSADDGVSTPATDDQIIGSGDGSRQTFQLIKTYEPTGPAPRARTITLPVDGSVVVAINGSPTTAFTVTRPGGIITFTSAPTLGAVITAGFEFEVPVRYEQTFEQWSAATIDAFDQWTIAALDLIEVLDEVERPEPSRWGYMFNHGTTSNDITISFAQGDGHIVSASGAINLFLPQPFPDFPGGPDIFTIYNSGSGSVQLRDDSGATVGSAISTGAWRRVACANNGDGTFTWYSY